MFRDAIPGLEKVFQTEPPEGSIILIVGCAGTLKSAFTYNLIANSLNNRSEEPSGCMFVSLEETRLSLLRNIQNMGIPVSDNIQITDIASFLKEIDLFSSMTNQMDYTDLILEKASRPFKLYKQIDHSIEDHQKINTNPSGNKPEVLIKNLKRKPTIFVLDSLNALNSIVPRNAANLRKEMASFMFKLRDNGITSFIIMEVGDPSIHRPEHFLVDGIIELGMTPTEPHGLKRYLKVQKMRSTKHSIEPFLIEVADNGIRVVEELI
jgi:KaiC/GvpD/RAD55 family RecA-like ATPase